MPTTLIVEDDAAQRDGLRDLVQREGFEDVRTAGTIAEARAEIAKAMPDVILTDLRLPDGSGVELLRDRSDGRPEVILITGHATVDSAVEALRLGVLDYLTKPIDVARLKAVLSNVSRTLDLSHEVGSLRHELRRHGRLGQLIGWSPSMQQVYDLIAKVAPTNATVLVTGDSGTGKEVVAQTIHDLSARRRAPLLAVNCGAISPTLIESELFGHERGSFTGAAQRHKGYFERAEGGTLFLDEITEMPIELQVKLLRVLESATYVRLGGEQTITADVRVIAATNQVPARAVADGKLREDLYYRLNVFPIALPGLRARDGDIELLARHFLDEINSRSTTRKQFTAAAIARLERHEWPGNVRELRNVVERAYILGNEQIEASHITPDLGNPTTAPPGGGASFKVGTSLATAEQHLILATLEYFEGDKKKTAETLGISLKTLYNRLNVYKSAAGR